MRRTLLVVLAMVTSALALTACGASTSSQSVAPATSQPIITTESTPTDTTTDTTTTESTPTDTTAETTTESTATDTTTETTPVASNGPAVLGDTRDQWDATHQADDRFEAGAAYDPSPDLGDGERFNDRFYTVGYDGDRVSGFSMRLPSQTSIGIARTAVMQDALPGDAKVVAFVRKDSCAQLFVSSRTLDTNLGRSVRVLAEFVSGEMGDSYDASSVSEAIVQTVTPAENPSNIPC